ncbi:MAG: hypothetical protein SNJ70_04705, partial [Armatimonadota bacterium]
MTLTELIYIVFFISIASICFASFQLNIDSELNVNIYDGSNKKIIDNEPLFILNDDKIQSVKEINAHNWTVTFNKLDSVTCDVTRIGKGQYNEECFEIRIKNNSNDAVDINLLPSFSSWSLDEKSINSLNPQYLLINDQKGAVFGSIGQMTCHSLGGSFVGSSFSTIPILDNKKYLCAFSYIKNGNTNIPSNQSVTFSLHIDMGDGDRNDALELVYRKRGGYHIDVSKYDYSEYERIPWVKDIVAGWINWSWDKDVIEPRTGEYNLYDSLLEAKKTIGGYDVYMFWPFWPRAGFDDRLQFDVYRDFPNGTKGIKEQISKAKELGTKIILGYCFWSEGDKFGWDNEDVQKKSFEELVDLVIEVGADGVIIDCMATTPSDILKKARLEGYNILSYNEWDPSWWESQTNLMGRMHNGLVMNYFNLKKYMAPHHPILRVVGTGAKNESMRNSAVVSFFNGHGYEILNMWPDRNPSNLKNLSIIARAIDILRTNRSNFQSTNWKPFIKTENDKVWANHWNDGKKEIYTLCGTDVNGHYGKLLKLQHNPNVHYVDLWRCRNIEPIIEDDFDIIPYDVDPYTPNIGIPIATGDFSAGCIAVLPKIIKANRFLEMLNIEINENVDDCVLEIYLDEIKPDSKVLKQPAKKNISIDIYKEFGYTNSAIIIRLMDKYNQMLDMTIIDEDNTRFFRIEKPERTKKVDIKNP